MSRTLERSADKNVLDLIWNNTTDAIFTIGYDGSIRNANPAFVDMLGWSMEELKGMAYPPFIVDLTKEKHAELLNDLKSGQDFPYAVIKRQERGGKQLDILASYRAINANGILAVVMYKDYTEQMRIQQKLEESEYCYRTLVEYLPEAIIKQQHGIIDLVNASGVEFFGQKQSEDIIGHSIWDFVSSERKEEIQKVIDAVYDYDRWTDPESIVEKFVRNDGSEMWAEVKLIPIGSKEKPDLQIVFRDITEKKSYESQLEFLAYHDPLTGFKNRRIFSEIVIDSIEEAKEANEKVAIMYIDIDHFKSINDTFGHGAGDKVLRKFAKRLQSCVRESDVICRIGGDEFLILLKDVKSKKQISDIAKKMQTAFQKRYKVKKKQLDITASIGIAIYPKDGLDGKRLISRADQALYRAKETRNAYMFYA